MVYWLGSERAKAFLSTEAHHPSPYASNPGTLLFFIPLELRRGVVALLRQRARVEPDGLREVSVFDAMLTRAGRQRALERAMDDNETSCLCCMSRPRAVRNQPCGHAIYCELCTIRSVRANGLTCAYRCAVPRLVVVSPTGDLPLLTMMETYLAEPEPEGRAFESLDAFLQAKLESDDAEVAEATQAALALMSRQGGGEEEEPILLFPIDAQGHATVPEGETEIPGYAFEGCASLISITLPTSLTSIGDSAFENCTSLVLTSLPDGLTSIGDHAFIGCASLVLTSLPGSLTSIGIAAFNRCRSLALTSLPDGVTSIERATFCHCTSLALTSLPDGLTNIDKHAFACCDSLKLTSLPDGLTNIGQYAFYNCTSLALTSLPDSITSISKGAFNGCRSLTLIRLPDGLTSIGQYAFAYCDSLALTRLPDGITSIGERAFEDCINLALTSLPDGLTLSSIGPNAFLRCDSLALTGLPDSLTSISQYTFVRSSATIIDLLGCRRGCLHLLVDAFVVAAIVLAISLGVYFDLAGCLVLWF